jgi:phage N-6-adenine-methyltransferase
VSLVNFRAKNHPQQVGKRGACDDTDDRETPPEIIDPLRAEHGFTLDVAASPHNARCPQFYTVAEDGLAQTWTGVVWCNPPYSDIRPWVEKAWRAMMVDGASVVVMLLPSNRTEQRWWQEHVEPYRDGVSQDGVRLTVRFLPGRPRFFRPSGKVGGPKGDRPPFGCCVLTWRRAA